jgi:hypothetical protein
VRNKRLCALVCSMLVIGSVLALWPAGVAAQDDFAGGEGTAENPYQISDWYHLDHVRDHLGDHFVLLNSFSAATVGYAELAAASANGGDGWQPIGDDGSPFTGSFDGKGYVIADHFISRGDQNFVGLFGHVGAGGVTTNLGVAGASVTGGSVVGGLVGVCDSGGTVSNCHASGGVTGSDGVGGLVGYCAYGTVSNCSATGSVTGSDLVAGLAGECGVGCTVSNCYASGSATATRSYVGGLMGWSGGTVSNCYASGSATGGEVVGGLLGSCESGDMVSNCYASGGVTGSDHVGGLVGLCQSGTVSNCFWDMQTSEMPSSSGGGTGKTTGEMLDMGTFTNWDIVSVASGELNPHSTWNIVDGRSYPFFGWYTMRFELKAGWNMVSVPRELPAGMNTVADVFKGEIVAIYTWNQTAKSYVVPDTVQADIGYWVAATEDKTICYVT